MTEDIESEDEETSPSAAKEVPTWPNLPGVPMDQRRRAFCLATSLESLPQAGSKMADIAKAAVGAAAIFEDYLIEGKGGLKLVAKE